MRVASNTFSSIKVAILQLCVCLWLASWFPNGTPMIRPRGYARDHQALLAIKSQLDDPLGATSSWNNSISICQWTGITCSLKHQRVTRLELRKKNLRGSLSPYIGNLSFLRFIDLRHNVLSGGIPPEMGHLSRLETLLLRNNSFGGKIPESLANCSKLIQLVTRQNKHVGNIPAEFGNLLKLETLVVDTNFLTGQLPVSFGNLSSLLILNVGRNRLQGEIPDTFGQLNRLVNLTLDQNNFSGLFPPSVYNISSLVMLSLTQNQFLGTLPEDIGFKLPNIKKFYIGNNNFTGFLPASLSNASKLEELDFSCNFFTGEVAIDFSNKNMIWLNLEVNHLGRGLLGDLDFITSLTNCSNLDTLSLDENQFGGMLPNSLINLSSTITTINLGSNMLTGTIPSEIANYANLNSISLANNQLTGTIPPAIGKLKNLQLVLFGANELSGRIPASLGNLSLITKLGLEFNLLEGSIPVELGKCQNLLVMSFGSNRLTGTLPKEIFNIVTFFTLDVSFNYLTGSFPLEVGNLKNLVILSVHANKFPGQIPTTLSSCTSLEILYLGNNLFHGNIPPSLSSLKSISELDLSNNSLSGQIPEYLEKLSFLTFLDLSYNQFEGQVPTKGVFSNSTAIALIGNDRLCGGIAELHLPLCNFKERKGTSPPLKLILIVCGVLGILLLPSCLFCWLRKRGVIRQPSSTFRLRNSLVMLSYHQLLKATDGFAPTNLIGQGSFGSVYRGVLNQQHEQNRIAVKVMNLQERGASKSFVRECTTLKNVRHRNLVKIVSACSSIDFQGNPFKALIYEFMPNGSLEGWLHPPTETNRAAAPDGDRRILNLVQRISIIIDVAFALDYLHHQCKTAVVHCDLKPSNILLDHDMVAHVGDFGLARFFPKTMNNSSGNSTSTLALNGTVGYIAPEYGIETEATTSGDMYSFGILLLEMFTGKRPIDDMFKDSLTLHHFTKTALPDQLLELVDPLLLAGNNEEQNASSKMKECLISILRVGIACSVESPKDRMDITSAAKELHMIKDKFFRART